MQLLSFRDVCKKLSVGKTSLYSLIKNQGFPPGVPLSVSPGEARRGAPAVRWLQADVDAWISARFGKEGGAQ
jgi:predicted DNA-binding transcriptional regulator AlpA